MTLVVSLAWPVVVTLWPGAKPFVGSTTDGSVWQLAFGYPCQRQPAVVNGVTESPSYAVLLGGWASDEGALSGLTDGTWQAHRGGVFGQVVRTQSVLQLATVGPVDPNIQVHAFGTSLSRAGYTLTTHRHTAWGYSRSLSGLQ